MKQTNKIQENRRRNKGGIRERERRRELTKADKRGDSVRNYKNMTIT